jgi:hypothetical protein
MLATCRSSKHGPGIEGLEPRLTPENVIANFTMRSLQDSGHAVGRLGFGNAAMIAEIQAVSRNKKVSFAIGD